LAEPLACDDAKRSFESKIHQTHPVGAVIDTVAVGLKTTLGPNTFPIIRDLADDIFVVGEKEILEATKKVWNRMKVMVEPSAGVGVAVLIGKEFREKYNPNDYRRVGVVLCGGNVDKSETCVKMMGLGIN
jgi:serine racemase